MTSYHFVFTVLYYSNNHGCPTIICSYLLSLQVLCVRNLSKQASLAQLVAIFSRFEQERAPPLRYRLLTGRMRGQAFITLPGPSLCFLTNDKS